MKFWEAIKAIEEGKSVRRVDWVSKKLHINKNTFKEFKTILDSDSEYYIKNSVTLNDFEKEWEIFNEPLKKWKWAVSIGGSNMITGDYYSEKDVLLVFGGRPVKLPWTEKEFEE